MGFYLNKTLEIKKKRITKVTIYKLQNE